MIVCYFGIYKSDFSRNKIYVSGLKSLGVDILECKDESRGIIKYIKLFLKHWKIRNSYDYLIVGYPGHAIVWFARLISKKPIIFDALCTMEEGVVGSRNQRGFLGTYGYYIKLIDEIAVKYSDIVLVETEAQRKFFEHKFVEHKKYRVVYTGVDEEFFYKDIGVNKKTNFTIVFRGKFLPEAGVDIFVKAAKLLEKQQDIDFLLIGNGFLEKQIKSLINELKPTNLSLISDQLGFDELRYQMLSSHISIGQLSDHPRLDRTIPHKCYETIAMGLPYLTARTKPVAEILKEGESVVFVNPADPQDLADKILYLKNNPEIAKKIGDNGYKVYGQRFTPQKLASNILTILKTLNPQK